MAKRLFARSLLPLIALLAAVLAASIEARYHGEQLATAIRHHRHERHHSIWEKFNRRRNWDESLSSRDEHGLESTERGRYGGRNKNLRERRRGGSATSRNVGNAIPPPPPPPPRRGGGRLLDEPRRWGRNRLEVVGPPRKGYRRRYPSSVSSGSFNRWRTTHRDPNAHPRRADYDYVANEDEEAFYEPRRSDYEANVGRRRRKNGGRAKDRRYDDAEDVEEEEEEEEEENDDYDYAGYYDDVDDDDERRARRRNVKKTNAGRKKQGEDLNEVEGPRGGDDVDDDGDYDDNWDVDEAGGDSSVKAIDDVIRKLSAKDDDDDDDDYDYDYDADEPDNDRELNYRDPSDKEKDERNHPRKTFSSSPRRGYRNTNSEPRDSTIGSKLPHRTSALHHRRVSNPWTGFAASSISPPTLTTTPTSPTTTTTTTMATTTTTTAKTFAKFGNELNALVTASNDKSKSSEAGRRVMEPVNDMQMKDKDEDMRTKSLEQEYEEYENDGNDDAGADAEAEDDKERISEKEQDYNEDENVEDEIESETERSVPTIPSTTTTTTTPRTLDHRSSSSRMFDTRSGHNAHRNSQIASSTTTTTTEYPQMSNHSAHKWKTLGSRKAVSEQRNSPVRDDIEKVEANNHYRWMSREGSCRRPRARVISVREVYPSLSKTYYPHCTILHRCADDTGCCNPDQTCVPKKRHTVELSFFAFVTGDTNVEKLKFDNHTECECRPRPRNIPSDPKPPPKKPCKCPSNFNSRTTSGGDCHCYCIESHQECIKLRRGKSYFSVNDQWCIRTKQCSVPYCEFGEYMRKQGRCPLKKDKFLNYHNNSNSRMEEKLPQYFHTGDLSNETIVLSP